VIFAIFCAKIYRPSDERGSAQKSAKITKTLMVVEREACVEALVRREAAILWIPILVILVIFAIFCAKIYRPSDEKGSAQKSAKITKALMVVEREACIESVAST
jgi:hypothetical protein